MDNFLVAGSNHGGMEGQISGLVAEAPLTSHDPARSVACRQNAGDRALYAQHKKKRRERHVTALPFRVSLRHAAVQLSSRFASLGSEEKVNAAWIWLQLALFCGVTLHFCITFLLVPALVHFTCLLWDFFTRFSCVTCEFFGYSAASENIGLDLLDDISCLRVSCFEGYFLLRFSSWRIPRLQRLNQSCRIHGRRQPLHLALRLPTLLTTKRM